MIDEEHYVFPHEQSKHEPTESERQAALETEDALNALDFRPIGYEW